MLMRKADSVRSCKQEYTGTGRKRHAFHQTISTDIIILHGVLLRVPQL